MLEVPATDFAKRFSQYRRAAQHGPVGVTHHGRVTEVLVSTEQFQEYEALKRRLPRAYWAWELPSDWVAVLQASAGDEGAVAAVAEG